MPTRNQVSWLSDAKSLFDPKSLFGLPPALSLYSNLGTYVFVGQAGQWLITNYREKVASIVSRILDFFGIAVVLSPADKDALAAAALFFPLLALGIVTALRRKGNLVEEPDADGFYILGAFVLAPVFMVLLAGATFSELLPFKEDVDVSVGKTTFGILVICMMLVTPLFFYVADLYKPTTSNSYAGSKWLSLGAGLLTFIAIGLAAPPIVGISLLICVLAIWIGVLAVPRIIIRMGTFLGFGFVLGRAFDILTWL